MIPGECSPDPRCRTLVDGLSELVHLQMDHCVGNMGKGTSRANKFTPNLNQISLKRAKRRLALIANSGFRSHSVSW
jgi:hypothetical protein